MKPDIKCYQHCGPKIFYLDLPQTCPHCQVDLNEIQILPISIPFPFVRASQHPCSVIIKPTIGSFLNDYFNSMDLHIGITSSNGHVYEFDQNGLQSENKENWNECLLLEQVPSSWFDHWDHVLHDLIDKKNCWNLNLYNSITYNCYTFVLKFLQALNYQILTKPAFNRHEFCEKFIVPKTTAAGKYISLYRRLKNSAFYIESVSKV